MRAATLFVCAPCLGDAKQERKKHRNNARDAWARAVEIIKNPTYANYRQAIIWCKAGIGEAQAAREEGIAELEGLTKLLVELQNDILLFPEAKVEQDENICKYCFPQLPAACERIKAMPAIVAPRKPPPEPAAEAPPPSEEEEFRQQIKIEFGKPMLAGTRVSPLKLQPLVYLGRLPERLYPLAGRRLGQVTEEQKADILKAWEEESKDPEFSVVEGGLLSVALWKCLHIGEDMLPNEVEAISVWAQVMIDTNQFEETWAIVERKLRSVALTRSALFTIALWKQAAGLQWSAAEAREYEHWKDKKAASRKKDMWKKIGIIVAASVGAALTAGALFPGLLAAIGNVMVGAAGLVWSGVAAIGEGIGWAATQFWELLAYGAKELAKGITSLVETGVKALTPEAKKAVTEKLTKVATETVEKQVTSFIKQQEAAAPPAVPFFLPEAERVAAPLAPAVPVLEKRLPWEIILPVGIGGTGLLGLVLFLTLRKKR